MPMGSLNVPFVFITVNGESGQTELERDYLPICTPSTGSGDTITVILPLKTMNSRLFEVNAIA